MGRMLRALGYHQISEGLCVDGLSMGMVGTGLKLQNVPDEVVVLIKLRQIIVPASMNPYQRYFSRINFLQLFTVPDRNQKVACSVNNVYRTFYSLKPLIGSQMITQHQPDRKDGQETFNDLSEVVKRSIQNQITRIIFRRDLRSKPTS